MPAPWNRVRPLDPAALAERFRNAAPFPHLILDDFLDPTFASAVAREYPDGDAARAVGASFDRVNETGKTQITDAARFPEHVAQLHEALSHPEFLATMSGITGIPNLLADPRLRGGGMHLMRPGARLDVHVDFNLLGPEQWHRRLNILVFLNPDWKPEWGGLLELWDEKVRERAHSLEPRMNRCVIFETSERSFHGVTPLNSPQGISRCSFAGYYYTREAPAGWAGQRHSTVFRARPSEHMRRLVLMPLDRLERRARKLWRRMRLSRG